MDIAREAARRRTFAIISHPDAGKSTLTEALALHTEMISEAGVTHGKAGRRATVSDWMEMEKARGISISSTALQMQYGDTVVNVVDTPGHADFSEDTYRVLAAVDVAVMVLDAAKGLEPQTLKLFDVCRRSAIPVITVVNKWDRPALAPLELLDQIQQRLGIVPTPVTWPIGIGGDFKGALDLRSGDIVQYHRTAGGATIAGEEVLARATAEATFGVDLETAEEEVELLAADGMVHDQETFLSGRTSPVLFAAGLLNFGLSQLLEVLVDLAPAAADRREADGGRRPVDAPFSAYVFKVQAGMDRNHRDHVAFARVCSGRFERGDVVEQAATKRSITTKYVQSMFGRDRSTADEAFPGDVIGLVNATGLRIGDTLRTPGERVEFPAIIRFAPEHFAEIRGADVSRSKQFRRGMDQLDAEGVVQVLRNDARGDAAPVLAAVGPMQFEVVQDRLANEFGAQTRLQRLDYSVARQVERADVGVLAGTSGVEVFERSDGTMLALFTDRWKIRSVERAHPDLELAVLAADVELA